MTEPLASLLVRGRPLEIRVAEPADDEALVDCFNSIFPVDHPSVRPMDLATWRWKYRAPGLARREMIVATHAEVGVVGAYPSQPLRARFEGQPCRTAQITDLMVRHAWRRVGERPGLFVQMGKLYYGLYANDFASCMAFLSFSTAGEILKKRDPAAWTAALTGVFDRGEDMW